MSTPHTPPTQAHQDRRHMQWAMVGIVIALIIIGLVQALVWARIAPGIQYKVFANGSYSAVPTANYHSFVAVALFVLSGAVLGLISAVAVWRIRALRGSVILVTLTAASVLGAVVAYLVAPLFTSGIDPATVGATGSESLVTSAPSLVTFLVVVAQPLAACITYTFLAAWDGRADLGRVRAVSVLSSKADDVTTN